MTNGRIRAGVLVALAIAVALVSTAAGSGAAVRPSWNETISPHVNLNMSEINAMVATGPGDVWAFGVDRAYIGGTFEWRALGEHWDGTSWTRVNVRDRETAPAVDHIWGAAATAPDNVWIVGSSLRTSSDRNGRNLVEHWDGHDWTIDDSAPDPGARPTLLAISARTADDIWAVGETKYIGGSDYNGFVIRRTASGWTTVPFKEDVPGCNAATHGELDAVVAVAENDVYVSGWCQSQPIGKSRGYVMHWNGVSWSLSLRVPGRSSLSELAVAPDGQVWVAGTKLTDHVAIPIVYHGTAATGWTNVPVQHSHDFQGSVGALSATAQGIVIAGQITHAYVSQPAQTFALRLNPDNGRWLREPINLAAPTGYTRTWAMAVEPTGTQWLGGTAVGSRLDPQALMARFG